MQRKQFLQALTLLPALGSLMNLRHLSKLAESLATTDRMPALFLGHGSPMNALEDNEFSRGWQAISKSIPKPRAILCVSAHWETRGTFVTAMEKPKTIHDFGGFPKALFEVQYPAPGSPAIAQETKRTVTSTEVGLDQQWGLDHGCWSVVKHLYPKADIPVLQFSLDYTKPPQYHYQLAKELSALRNKGILIAGSGNMVHNLGIIDWQNPSGGYDWAVEANTKMKAMITSRNHADLINYSAQGKAFQLSIPTNEHYLPLLYILAMQGEKENTSFFNDKTIMGSIAMTSVVVKS